MRTAVLDAPDVRLDSGTSTGEEFRLPTELQPDEAEKTTGYVVGGVSPVGQKRPLATVVDASALGHRTVLCSAGRRGWEIELDPAELVRVTAAVTAPVTTSR